MALSPQWLDELRARVTLSSVIMRTDKLQKAGREWKACCPFHDEKSPSFTVNDQKGFYHCFGCGAHGDVIRWMTDQRGLPFMDAVKELAADAGMEVPAPDPRAAQQAEKRATLIDVTEAAQSWMVDNLHGTGGQNARDYLTGRGFAPNIIREFGFGFAPSNKQALASALSQFDEDMLVEAGMRIRTDDGNHYDRFRERIMLPIQDNRGRVIAFGGRILVARDKVAKYLNSPDTPLFDKGRTLYNIHRAGPASRKSNRMIVVEGYMDVIALANAGIADAVAPLGTALTENQIELLWRMVDVPILCFDGDAAGQRAASRAITRALPMLRPGYSLQITRLPSGLDPDDLIKERGTAAMESLLDSAQSMVETLWLFERDARSLSTPEDKAGLKARLLDHVDTIGHDDIKALYRRELLQRFSDFAFPPRERSKTKFSNQKTSSNVARLSDWGRKYVSPRLLESWSNFEQHSRNRLGAALVHASLLRPKELENHVEYLYKLYEQAVDKRLLFLAQTLEEQSHDLEEEELRDLLNSNSFSCPTPDEWHNIKFPFVEKTSPHGDETYILESMRKGLRLYYGIPLVNAQIILAEQKFGDDDVTEEWMVGQQELVKKLVDLKIEFEEFIREEGRVAA